MVAADLAALLPRAWRSAGRVTAGFVSDPLLTTELLAWRVCLPLLKRALPLPTLARWMRATPRTRDDRRRAARLEQIRRLVSSGGRVLLSTHCVERSLVLYRLFSAAGATPALVLGMRRGPGVAGHAWIEIDGQPLGESDITQFDRVLVIQQM